MTHPIAPPSELVQRWFKEASGASVFVSPTDEHIATCAAQWGADQELEALLTWLRVKGFDNLAADLLAARRPKPPSLKEQACAALDAYIYGNPDHGDKQNTYNTIRRALEALSDD